MPYDWSGLTGPQGLLGSGRLGDLGWGLLAQGGPSTQPTSFGSALGKAGLYANERADQRIMNDARRADIAASAQEQAGLANMSKWMSENPGATDDQIMAAAMTNMPALAVKSRLGNILSPQDRIAMQANQLQMLKLSQDIKENTAGSATPSGATARAVGTLADVFDTAEKEGNPFAPGGTFGSESILGKAGLNPSSALSMPDMFYTKLGLDPATVRRQAGQAMLIDKETATISQNLTQLAEKGTGRSATALNNLNTALGAGNVPIPVRRKVILSTLETVIDDVTSRGNEVPKEWTDLRDRLRGQTENVTKGGEEGNVAMGGAPQGYSPGAPGGFTAQPPPVYGPPGSGVAPPTNISPPVSAAGAGPGAVPGSVVPPPPVAPPVRKVTTVPIDPLTGNQMRRFGSKAEAISRANKGETVLYMDTDGRLKVWGN